MEVSEPTNPAQIALREIQNIEQWKHRPIDCIVSLGTGVPRTTPTDDSLPKLASWLSRVATDCEKEHDIISHQRSSYRHYFRFNVKEGLGDFGLDASGYIKNLQVATQKYLDEYTTKEDLDKLCKLLKAVTFSVDEFARSVQQTINIIQSHPILNQRFLLFVEDFNSQMESLRKGEFIASNEGNYGRYKLDKEELESITRKIYQGTSLFDYDREESWEYWHMSSGSRLREANKEMVKRDIKVSRIFLLPERLAKDKSNRERFIGIVKEIEHQISLGIEISVLLYPQRGVQMEAIKDFYILDNHLVHMGYHEFGKHTYSRYSCRREDVQKYLQIFKLLKDKQVPQEVWKRMISDIYTDYGRK